MICIIVVGISAIELGKHQEPVSFFKGETFSEYYEECDKIHHRLSFSSDFIQFCIDAHEDFPDVPDRVMLQLWRQLSGFQ